MSVSSESKRIKTSTGGLTILGTSHNALDLKNFLKDFDGNFFVLYNREMCISNKNPAIVISHLEESKHDRIKLFYRKEFGTIHTLPNITCRKISKVLKEI